MNQLTQTTNARRPVAEFVKIRESTSCTRNFYKFRYSEVCVAIMIVFLICGRGFADDAELPPLLQGVGIDQRLGEQVPLDTPFRDETGKQVMLSDYFGEKPVVLVLAYFRCPRLCNEVLNGLESSLEQLNGLDIGRQFNVLTVSFDPQERPPLAAAKKASYIEKYDRPGAANGWHFLTGDSTAIKVLTEAVGFRYHYDPQADQFAHASGIMVLTPQGKLSRYFYGIRYPAGDMRLALVESSNGKIGSPVDQLLLFCFHYDPSSGKYTPIVMNIVRLGGIVTLLVFAVAGVVFWRGERRRKVAPSQVGVPPSGGVGQASGLTRATDRSAPTQ